MLKKNPVKSGKKRLSHLAANGDVRMIEIGAKPLTKRTATARALIELPADALAILRAGGDTAKGNVLQIARIAGIQAAKKTAELIPLCHQLALSGVVIDLRLDGARLEILATARCTGPTGVEMEALTAASVAALTVYDMLKAVSHDLVIRSIELLHKDGGRSGAIHRTPSP